MTAELIRPLRNFKNCAGTQEGVPSRFTSCESVFVGPGTTHNCLDPLRERKKIQQKIQLDPCDYEGHTHTLEILRTELNASRHTPT